MNSYLTLKLPNEKKVHMISKSHTLKTLIINLSKLNYTFLFKKSKNLQHFYDQLISLI